MTIPRTSTLRYTLRRSFGGSVFRMTSNLHRVGTWYGMICDFLLITQRVRGPFLNVGPTGVEEVLQDNLEGILKPGEREDEACERIFRELGRQMYDTDRIS